MSRPTRHASHAAHERKPLFQPPRMSNSRQPHSGRVEVDGQHRNLVAQLLEGTNQHVSLPCWDDSNPESSRDAGGATTRDCGGVPGFREPEGEWTLWGFSVRL